MITFINISGLDPDAKAFLDATAITDVTITRAINTLVIDLKGFGVWSKCRAIYPMVGGTATTHMYNLKDPQNTNAAFRLLFSGGWTHSSTGALPNGTNAYANTVLNPSVSLTNFNTSITFYSRTNSNGVHFDMGSSNLGSTQIMSIYSRLSGNAIADTGNFNTSRINVATANSLGFYHINRSSNNSLKLFKNGNIIGTNTNVDNATLPNQNINIGAVFLTNFTQFSNRECAFASIGNSFTDTEATNFYTAVQAFQTTLGRNV